MFKEFAELVRRQFDEMSKHELFVVDISRDLVWERYLKAFPHGTDPMFRARTEHDCSCCRNFIKNVGNVVAIINGKKVSIWEGIAAKASYPYDVVAADLANLVTNCEITNLFRTAERKFGNGKSIALNEGATETYHHFEVNVMRQYNAASKNLATILGDKATTASVFKRGLEELSLSAFDTVIDLINGNKIYRGAEFKESVVKFRKMVADYATAPDKNVFLWNNIGASNTRFRNTLIGTLVEDLSKGEELEKAVNAFEKNVAPENYKRPTALVTPMMINKAMETIQELDLEASLERRFAKVTDVSVNNVLWVDNAVRGSMKGGLKELLMASAVKPSVTHENAVEISIDEFMEKVLPKATQLEMLVENKHLGNFVSLTAPVHEDTNSLFKWSNDFAWSYDGNFTDSIKERVKSAGGNVTSAQMRVSLAWFNTDDLDLHVIEPNFNEIAFYNKDGKLDVDMNNGFGALRKDAVENVSWKRGSLQNGKYEVVVNQYNRRNTSDVGFDLEVEFKGRIETFSFESRVDRRTQALTIHVENGKMVKIDTHNGVKKSSGSVEKWGVKTQEMRPVDTVMLSPNHWDDNAVGNKHFIFMLKGCLNPEPTRGIYNEYLSSKLETHRKVFELLGEKTKCPQSTEQLSGLGFSSTRNDQVIVAAIVEGAKRTFSITF